MRVASLRGEATCTAQPPRLHKRQTSAFVTACPLLPWRARDLCSRAQSTHWEKYGTVLVLFAADDTGTDKAGVLQMLSAEVRLPAVGFAVHAHAARTAGQPSPSSEHTTLAPEPSSCRLRCGLARRMQGYDDMTISSLDEAVRLFTDQEVFPDIVLVDSDNESMDTTKVGKACACACVKACAKAAYLESAPVARMESPHPSSSRLMLPACGPVCMPGGVSGRAPGRACTSACTCACTCACLRACMRVCVCWGGEEGA